MYAGIPTRCIMDWNLKNLVSGICFHSGRTDSDFGHHDFKNASGLGTYHWHHGEGAHLHPHNSMNAEIWVDGYLNGKKYEGYLDTNENRVYTKDFLELLATLGSCTGKIKGDTVEILEPNIKKAKVLPLKSGYVKLVDFLQGVEDACGYYVSNTKTVNGVFIVELKSDRMKSIIFIGEQQIEGYFDANENRIYTKNFPLLLKCLGAYINEVVETDLEINVVNLTNP